MHVESELMVSLGEVKFRQPIHQSPPGVSNTGLATHEQYHMRPTLAVAIHELVSSSQSELVISPGKVCVSQVTSLC